MSTSKNWATAALVSCALLLSGCAALEDMASDFSPSGEEVAQAEDPTPVAKAPLSTGEYNLVESCNAFFTGPVVSSITEAAESVRSPLDEARTGAAVSISRNIGLLIGKADESSIAHLETIRAPFDQALDGSIARPSAVTEGIDAYKAACKEAGYKN